MPSREKSLNNAEEWIRSVDKEVWIKVDAESTFSW